MTRPHWMPALLFCAALLAGCAESADPVPATAPAPSPIPAAGQPGAQPIMTELPEEPEPPECPVPLPDSLQGPGLKVASFTIDNLGVYSSRDNHALTCLLGQFDLVAVHDVAVPPYAGNYPDGEPYRPDPASTGFFEAMRAQGFAHVIGPEDTGPGRHTKLTSGITAWPVVFYKRDRLTVAGERPSGYIEPKRSANPLYSYVPHAVTLRTLDGRHDFLLITGKLAEDSDQAGRRRAELSALANWIESYRRGEPDVLVLLDSQFRSCGERDQALPAGATVADPVCRITDVSRKRLGDVAFLMPGATAQLEGVTGIGIVEAMYPFWVFGRGGAYPGSPYNPALFDQYYSGSTPLAFRLVL